MANKRLFYVLLVTVLALFLVVAAVSAQGRGGQYGTSIRVLGQPYVAPTGPKANVAQPAKHVMPPNNAAKMAIAQPAAAGPFVYRLHETYEGAWPTGDWYTYDNNGPTGGDVCWDDDNWIAFQGMWSGWAAGGCADGLDATSDYYVDDMDSWAVIGPFSTEHAKSGWVQFKWWNDSEEDYDYFYWCASVDNSNFYCKSFTGDSEGWRNGRLNLRGMPYYGNMLGEEQVWVAFIFTSDYSNTDDGAFIDQVRVVVRK